MYLLRPAAMAACDICYNHTWLKAFRDNLGLQIIRPLLCTPTMGTALFGEAD
jgi:hypothetical protein